MALGQFIINTDQSTLVAAINKQMRQGYVEATGNEPGLLEKPVLNQNAKLVAQFTQTALKETPVLSGDTPETYAAKIAKNVEESLRKSSDPLLSVAVARMGDAYFTRIREGLQTEITANLQQHEAQFAALKPTAPRQAEAPVVTAEAPLPPAPSTQPAPTVAEAAQEPTEPEEPKAAATTPPETRVAEAPPTAPEEETRGIVAHVLNALNPISSAAAAEPETSPPAAAAAAAAGATAAAAAATQAEAPPPAPTPPAPPAPPAFAMPSTLSALFTQLNGLDENARKAGIPVIQNLLNVEEARRDSDSPARQFQEKLKTTVREAIKKMGQDPKDYSDKDITAMADVLQESGQEWLNKHSAALQQGNLEERQTYAMSHEFASLVRRKMSPERVGKFAQGAGPMGMVDVVEIITGVDEEGKVTRPFEMNLFGLTLTATTAISGDEAAKKKLQQNLAYDESYRQFYAQNEDGVTADMASRAAVQRMQKAGYNEQTQAAVGNMAQDAFKESPFLDFINKLMFYVMQFFNALFSGNMDKFLVSAQDGSLSAYRRREEANEDNKKLYNRILRSTPEALGYTGAPGDFAQWRSALATEATGLYQTAEGKLAPFNPQTGTFQGISAITRGLDVNGNSRIPGQEDIKAVLNTMPGIPNPSPAPSAPTPPAPDSDEIIPQLRLPHPPRQGLAR